MSKNLTLEELDQNGQDEGLYCSGIALALCKSGNRMTRLGWHGHGMFIFNVPGSTFEVNRPPLLGIFPEGTEITYHSHIDICLPDGSIAVWNPSQVDMDACDWVIHHG